MTNLLSSEEYQHTLTEEMTNVTTSGEAVLDIWPYIAELIAAGIIPQEVYDHQVVEVVYRTSTDVTEHVLIPMGLPNVYMALVIDLPGKAILGHHFLDLNEQYGTT